MLIFSASTPNSVLLFAKLVHSRTRPKSWISGCGLLTTALSHSLKGNHEETITSKPHTRKMPYSYPLSFLHQPLHPCSSPGPAILVKKKGADGSSGWTRSEGSPEKDVCKSGEVCWRSHSCSVRAGTPFSPPPVSGHRLGWDLLSILRDAQERKLSHPLPQSHLQMTSPCSSA